MGRSQGATSGGPGAEPPGGPEKGAPARPAQEYRIDELARLAGTTVRNVRAYQDRGLLPPPRRLGRVALYSEAHRARLLLVGQLLERGYTLANIGELLDAWEAGQNVADLLGLEAALGAPWSTEGPTPMGLPELEELFGGAPPDPGALERAEVLGVLERRGADVVVRRPAVLRAGAALVASGVPLEAVLALGEQLQASVDDIAAAFVGLVASTLFPPAGDPIPADDAPGLTAIVGRLRPLAGEAVAVELADAMERRVATELRQRLDAMVGTGRAHRGRAS